VSVEAMDEGDQRKWNHLPCWVARAETFSSRWEAIGCRHLSQRRIFSSLRRVGSSVNWGIANLHAIGQPLKVPSGRRSPKQQCIFTRKQEIQLEAFSQFLEAGATMNKY
jgi:hypothetical protein